MAESTVLRDSDGKVYTDILDFMCQKCDLSREDAKSKYDGYKDKKKAKMHNLHQEEMIELLQEKEAEGEWKLSEDAYVKNSEFYFTKYEGKPSMTMVEEGRTKAQKRYEKLKVHEKWLLHQALVDQPTEIKQLQTNQEQLGGYIDEWKTKYNKLKEEKENLAEENKNSKKEIKKLKKMLKDQKTGQPVQTGEPEEKSNTKSPTKRKNSNSEDPEKIEKKRRKNIFDTAPAKPPGNALGLYVRQHKVMHIGPLREIMINFRTVEKHMMSCHKSLKG